MKKPYIITRAGSTNGDDSRAHFMQGYGAEVTACGKRTVSSWGCTKDWAISNVDCPGCWEIKRNNP